MRLLFLILPITFLFACNNQQQQKGNQEQDTRQQQIDQLKDEVIAIHDEVMPKTADINRVKRKLKVISKDVTITEPEKAKLLAQITELTKADEAMSKWMAEFKQPTKDDQFEVAMKMLNEEKDKIKNVKELMLSSLENGKQLLDEMQKEKQ